MRRNQKVVRRKGGSGKVWCESNSCYFRLEVFKSIRYHLSASSFERMYMQQYIYDDPGCIFTYWLLWLRESDETQCFAHDVRQFFSVLCDTFFNVRVVVGVKFQVDVNDLTFPMVVYSL